MKSFDDVYAPAMAEARSQAEAKYRDSAYERTQSETEAQHRDRVNGWVERHRWDIEREAKAAVIPKLEAAIADLQAEHNARASAIQAALNSREADVYRAKRAVAAKIEREPAARDAAQATLTDAETRGIPVAQSATAARIYASSGFEYVDATSDTPKLIPVQ